MYNEQHLKKLYSSKKKISHKCFTAKKPFTHAWGNFNIDPIKYVLTKTFLIKSKIRK